MKPQFYKTGIINTSRFLENDAMNTVDATNSQLVISFTPTNTENSKSGHFVWYTPEGAHVNDIFRVSLTIEYKGFDTSNTSGAFRMWFEGMCYDAVNNTWTWSGTRSVCNTLNNTYSPSDLVLSSARGMYIYNATMILTDTNISQYTGQRIALRSDYSNGIGTLTMKDFKVILEKYATNSNTSQRFGKDYIATQEFIEL